MGGGNEKKLGVRVQNKEPKRFFRENVLVLINYRTGPEFSHVAPPMKLIINECARKILVRTCN